MWHKLTELLKQRQILADQVQELGSKYADITNICRALERHMCGYSDCMCGANHGWEWAEL